MAFSEGRPSLLMNPPGILPTEYIFSSNSTLSGRKSTPSRGALATVAHTSTAVSPQRISTLPPACSAYLPVSAVIVRPANSIENILCICFFSFL